MKLYSKIFLHIIVGVAISQCGAPQTPKAKDLNSGNQTNTPSTNFNSAFSQSDSFSQFEQVNQQATINNSQATANRQPSYDTQTQQNTAYPDTYQQPATSQSSGLSSGLGNILGSNGQSSGGGIGDLLKGAGGAGGEGGLGSKIGNGKILSGLKDRGIGKGAILGKFRGIFGRIFGR